MPRYGLAPGVRVEPLGPAWAAYSPLSGETILLNDESAAILELLAHGDLAAADVVSALATDTGLPPDVLAPILDGAWPRLIEGGLVCSADRGGDNPAR